MEEALIGHPQSGDGRQDHRFPLLPPLGGVQDPPGAQQEKSPGQETGEAEETEAESFHGKVLLF
jgi:hypothetical protein